MMVQVFAGIRRMEPIHQQEYKEHIDALLDQTPIPCDWDTMDLNPLAERSNDATVPEPPDEKKQDNMERFYNVNDHVLIKADKNETPNQRFWVGRVMNVTYCNNYPDINSPDPNPDENGTEYYKIWWFSAKEEFGVYKVQHHFDDGGVKRRSMSWEESTQIICKLQGGLNGNGRIKNYANIRQSINYDIARAWQQLDGPEDLPFNSDVKTLTESVAETYLTRSVLNRNVAEDGLDEEGTVTDYLVPDDNDDDQSIRFVVQYDDHCELLTHSQLTDILVA